MRHWIPFPGPSLPSQRFFLAASSPVPPFLPVVRRRRVFLGLDFHLLSVPRPPGVALRASHPHFHPPPAIQDFLVAELQRDQGEGQGCEGESLARQSGPKGLEPW